MFNAQAQSNALWIGVSSQVGLQPQSGGGSGTSNIGWVYIANGSTGPVTLLTNTFEANENFKAAFGFNEYPPQGAPAGIGKTILQGIANLPSQSFMPHGFHLSWNDESWGGVPLPDHKIGNNNVDFCGPPDPVLTSNGHVFGVSGACPVATFGNTPTYSAPTLNFSGNTVNAIDEAMMQVMNRYIRGLVTSPSSGNAHALFDSVASLVWKDSQGCIGFGAGPGNTTRGIYLGAFLHCARTMQYTPAILAQKGITLADFDACMGTFQSQQGSIPRNYTSFTSGAGTDNETSNVALLGYCFKLQAALRQISASGIYTPTTVPPAVYSMSYLPPGL